MHHISLATLALAKKTFCTHTVLRSFLTLSSYYLSFPQNREANLDALAVLEQSLYILEHYQIAPFLKSQVLANYVECLRREERHFEATEYFQLIQNLPRGDSSHDSELFFLPSYFM